MHATLTESPALRDPEPDQLLAALLRLRRGEAGARLPDHWSGPWRHIAETFNDIVTQNLRLAHELDRLARVVGQDGRLKERARLPDATGFWRESADAVNALIAALVHPTSEVARVIGAVAQGDLSKSMALDIDGRALRGEFLRTATTINRMVQQLGTFADEVTRVAREVGTEGKLGGQADVQGVAGTWKDLTDNVNSMASNLTSQVRNIADVTKAVAAGDLSRKITVDVQGEILGLKNTINTMVDQLRAFASEVTRVAREVGAEGRLGGQADVPGAAGTWKALTENVNQLAANLTSQVRAIAEVATAVTQGDLTRSISVQACGEVAALKDTINEMIRNLRDTTQVNTEQVWLKTQLAQELQSRQLELQHTNEALQEKARQVALTSKYKSEFLANMSHELRTPLNSLLILSEQLARNGEGNLSARQVEFAKTIHSSGNDLLMLINDILDLSKIESGTVVVDVSELRLSEMQRYVERNFRHVAESRGVAFEVDCRLRPSVAIRTDIKRLQQILKNLLSNAFKFTLQGAVRLDIREVREGWTPEHPELSLARRVIAFVVSDTGIGISAEKQQIIFDAFQQADGSTSRKYGGTGLGLAISRELSRLLGGEIRLASMPGQGSTFTLYLPLRAPAARGVSRPATAPAHRPARRTPVRVRRPAAGTGEGADGLEPPVAFVHPVVSDDRDRLRPCDAVLLIVQDDLESAGQLLAAARARGFKGVVSATGAGALALASFRQPSAVALGHELADMAGWRLLARFKHDLALRHIPLCQVGTAPLKPAGAACVHTLAHDAMAALAWPQDREGVEAALERLRAYGVRRQRRILVALKDLALQRDLLALLEDDLIQPTVVRSVERAAFMVRRDAFDAWVLDASLVGPAGSLLRTALQEVSEMPMPGLLGPVPVALYAPPGTLMTPLAGAIRVRQAATLDALFDATLCLLHHPLQRLPQERCVTLQALLDRARPLAGKRVLIVDDDMRNIFALASVLEEHGMDIVWADNGREAIHRVANDPLIGVVLMDIMMPELDGLATLREIRRLPRGRDVPLIAVTAKAMKGDREKCIEAGAWDYLSKPVNPQELLTALRAWITP